MTVIRRAECPTCGRVRDPDMTIDRGGACRGPWALNEHEPAEWVMVEYVPRDDLRGAVEEARKLRLIIADLVEGETAEEGTPMWYALRNARAAIGGS